MDKRTDNLFTPKVMKMEDSSQNYLKGQMLIAMPELADPNFSRSLSFICEHNEDGALGIVVNRIHPFVTTRDIFDELGIPVAGDLNFVPVHVGGPVHMSEIFVLHGPPFGWEGCMMITADIALSNTIDIIKAIGAGEVSDSFIIALGCAGWGGYQLETEIMANTWITCPGSKGLIFDLPVESRWEAAMRGVGVDPLLISGTPGRA